MQTYTVHEPPNPPSDRIDRADGLEFVKDGFSWVTAIFPPIGFAAERMWVPLAIYLGVVTALAAAFHAIGIPAAWTSIFATALNVFLGFELPSLKRWTLDRAGWNMLGAVTGRDLAECERRFLESWLPSQPAVTTARPTSPSKKSGLSFGGFWPFAAGS
ncbi:MAG: DUF2628 domain-containing protein [Hyphomicrobium sp.]